MAADPLKSFFMADAPQAEQKSKADQAVEKPVPTPALRPRSTASRWSANETWMRPAMRALSFLLPGKAKAFPVAELEAAKAWLAESGT